MKLRSIAFLFVVVLFGFLPVSAYAQLQFTEIMYDAPGTDADHEWIEIYNAGTSSVDITGWKFNDGSNHTLNAPPANGGTGSMNIPQGGYVVLAANATQFLVDYPSFVGTVVDTVMSLNNTGDTLTLVDKSNVVVSTVDYTGATGAAGDGKSLQRDGNTWGVGTPTPGAQNILSSGNSGPDTSQSGAPDISPQTLESQNKNEVKKSAPYPQISANITMQKTAFTGIVVPVRVTVSGPFKEYLKYGKFLWNMGDGSEVAARDDAPFEYVYEYPGVYTVVFEYYRNPYNTEPDLSMRSTITVSDPGIEIKSIDSLGKITLLNTATTELNLFGWKLADSSGNLLYTFPRNTFVLPNKEVIFSAKALKLQMPIESLSIISPLGQIRAVYPEPKKINTYTPDKKDISQNTFSFVGGASIQSKSLDSGVPAALSIDEATATSNDSETQNAKDLSLFVLFFVLLCFAGVSVVYLRRLRNEEPQDDKSTGEEK